MNRKRFVTQELKDLERDIMKAHQEINGLQNEVLDRVKQEVAEHLTSLRQMAYALAYLDGLFGFARAAYEQRYVAPQFSEDNILAITEGRHPVVELQVGRSFVSNDTTLNESTSLMIITGPNMGGKSTYLRQLPLMSIMAQCGSFVPASQAIMPIVDRIFTRIGSGDNVAEGKSTFLIEMEEAATICTQATVRSLVILDEVGRGTSTFDGMALAQAIIEHIVTALGAKCLFATHYHELTKLAELFPTIKNYHMVCHKKGQVLHFLHKLQPGIAHQSFGLEVARLARMPEPIVHRATTILQQLQGAPVPQLVVVAEQHDYVVQPAVREHDVVMQLRDLEVDDLTPRQALELLWSMKAACK